MDTERHAISPERRIFQPNGVESSGFHGKTVALRAVKVSLCSPPTTESSVWKLRISRIPLFRCAESPRNPDPKRFEGDTSQRVESVPSLTLRVEMGRNARLQNGRLGLGWGETRDFKTDAAERGREGEQNVSSLVLPPFFAAH